MVNEKSSKWLSANLAAYEKEEILQSTGRYMEEIY